MHSRCPSVLKLTLISYPIHFRSLQKIRNGSNRSSCEEGFQEGGESSPTNWWQEEAQEKERELRHLHLQGAETSSSRHWCLKSRHVNHEQLRQRHLRTNRRRSISPDAVQQEIYNQQPRSADSCPPSPARRIGQACCERGYQSGDEVHHFEVNRLNRRI